MSRVFMHKAGTAFKTFRRDETGVALVEFAIFLPLFLLAFFVIVEFSRIFFSFQGAVSGVRDATRYLARTTDADICVDETTGGIIDDSTIVAAITAIIARNMNNENDVLPENVEITSVSLLYRCVLGAEGTYRQREVPIARVTAGITITLPLIGVLDLNNINLGLPEYGEITTNIAEESRVFGV